MRLCVHDYSGHPFQVQLSRWLARQGHEVLHLYSADMETPHGALERRGDDAPGFAVEPVSAGARLMKYRLVRRRRQERAYARRLAARVGDYAPELVLAANAPPEIQRRLQRAARRAGAAFVFWVQDVYSEAIARVLRRRLPLIGEPVIAYYRRLEFATLRASDAVVAITDDFRPLLAAGGVEEARLFTVENWAPLGEIGPAARDNPWARARGLAEPFVFLYSGTLGLKHDPGLLAALARRYRDEPAVRVAVVTQGLGRAYLERIKAAEGLDNLLLLDFQPYETLEQVLASADVLLVILEPHASVFAVPSKVLTYLCTARPILAAVPAENLAARTVERAGAGCTVAPGDEGAFLAAAQRLRADAGLRRRCAEAGRAYAEGAFDIDAIGRRFLQIFAAAKAPRP